MNLHRDPLGNNYSIVEEREFLEKIYKLVGRHQIWDDTKRAFDQLLSRNPEAVGSPVWGAWRTLDLLAADGKVWVLYRVDHEHRHTPLSAARAAPAVFRLD